MKNSGFGVPKSCSGGCVAIGNFDGVHRGHRRMLTALKELSVQQNTRSIAVTFHPHPIAILRPEQAPPLLSTIPDRCRLLKSAGVDDVVVLPVTPELLSMTSAEFFDEFLMDTLAVRGLVEGPNFRFGRDRGGDISELSRMCARRGIPLQVVELVTDGATEISSSRIRQLIQSGHVAAAVELLGHPLRLRGHVQKGAGRGAQLGFPTANLSGIQTLLPAEGVYAGMTEVDDHSFVTAVSIGPNPTFGELSVKVECHLEGFQGGLYGQELAVDLIGEVRGLRTFSGPAALISQIQIDMAHCRRQVASWTGVP